MSKLVKSIGAATGLYLCDPIHLEIVSKAPHAVFPIWLPPRSSTILDVSRSTASCIAVGLKYLSGSSSASCWSRAVVRTIDWRADKFIVVSSV